MEHILLLEDDIALGNGICLALQSPYLRISLYRTLAQAGEALEQGGFDLLILDVNLPDGSGLDLLRRVHALPEPGREVVYLRVFGGLSFREIGDVLGRTETWARVTFYRGKEKLRDGGACDEK